MRSTPNILGLRDSVARALTVMIGLRFRRRLPRWAWFLFGLLLAVPVLAHEGEVHNDFPVSASGPASEPRFATASDTVEVVGVLQGGQLWLYVSRFATNAPWSGLRIEIERDGSGVRAEPVSEGVYRIAAGELEYKGRHTVVMSLQDGGLDELLTAQLVVDREPEQDAAQPWLEMSAGMALLAAVVAMHLLHGWRVRRRVQR